MADNTSISTLTIKLDNKALAASTFQRMMEDAMLFADRIHDIRIRDVTKEYKDLLNRTSILVQLVGGEEAANQLQALRNVLSIANEGLQWRDELDDMRDEEGFAYQIGDTVWTVINVVDDKLVWEQWTIAARRGGSSGRREYQIQAPGAEYPQYGFFSEISLFLDDKKHASLTK